MLFGSIRFIGMVVDGFIPLMDVGMGMDMFVRMGMYLIAMPMFVGVNMGVFVGVLQADGKTTYTATAIFGGQTYTDTKIVTIPATGHITHVAEEKWRTDGTHHWKKCTGCDTKLESSKHTGETATCMEKAVCAVCEQPYGSEDPRNHSFTRYISDHNAICKKNGTKTAKCDYGCGTTDTVTDRGSKLEHKFENGKCIRCGLSFWKPDTGDIIMIAIVTLAVSGAALLILLIRKKGNKEKTSDDVAYPMPFLTMYGNKRHHNQ